MPTKPITTTGIGASAGSASDRPECGARAPRTVGPLRPPLSRRIGLRQRKPLRWLAALAVALVSILLLPIPAQAITFHSNYGYPGWVQSPRTDGWGNYTNGNFTVRFNPRYVGRSSAYRNYGQAITVTYRTWAANGGNWTIVNRAAETAYTYPQHSSAYFPGHRQEFVIDLGSGGTHFSVDMVIEWRTFNGTLLARTIQDYNLAGDYRCYEASYAYCMTTTYRGSGGFFVKY